MVLQLSTDYFYLSKSQESNQSATHLLLSALQNVNSATKSNFPIYILCGILKHVVISTEEPETWGTFMDSIEVQKIRKIPK